MLRQRRRCVSHTLHILSHIRGNAFVPARINNGPIYKQRTCWSVARFISFCGNRVRRDRDCLLLQCVLQCNRGVDPAIPLPVDQVSGFWRRPSMGKMYDNRLHWY